MNKKLIFIGIGTSMIVGGIYGLVKRTVNHIRFLNNTIDELCLMNVKHIQTEIELREENNKLRKEKESKK